MASYKCWKCGELYDYKQSLACHMKYKYSEEDNGYDADTDDDDNDSKDIKKENNANLSIRYDGLGHFSWDKYGQRVANQESDASHYTKKTFSN